MKQRWMRRVSVILVLCLLFSDNFKGVFLTTQAVDNDTPVASVDVSGNDVVSEEDVTDEEITDEETAGEEVADEENPEGENVSGEATDEENPDEETVSEEVNPNEENGDGETVNEEITEETVGEENTEDEAPVSGGDSPIEEEELEKFLAPASDYTLPSTLSEYRNAYNSGRREFYISTADDFIDAQNLCEEDEVNGFSGVTLVVSIPSSSGIWDIASISGFQGIGLTKPFKGTLTCSLKNGNGIQFKINKPIVANMGDGATMKQMDIICNGSSSAIAQNISGSVTLSDLWIRGTIGTGSGTVGLFASSMESGSSVTISNSKIKDNAIAISGAIAGGYAGTAGDNVTINWNSSADFNDFGNNTVTGTDAAGGCFGTVTGSYTFNVAGQSYYPLQVRGAGYYGQVVGTFVDANGNGTLTITGGNELQVNLSAIGDTAVCGGIVGYLKNATDMVLPNGGLTISGTMDGNADTCGGVAGKISGDGSHVILELENITINTAVIGNWSVGGLVGHLGWGKYIIKNVNINGQVDGGATGGLIGAMDCVALELGENIAISEKPTGWGNTGLLVGERYQQCFVYFAKPGIIENTVTTSVTGLEEIGMGGNVFRNQNISGGVLIGNGTLSAVGYVNGRVNTSGDWYRLTSASDFECLAIVLSTRGCHGCEAFGKYNFSPEHYEEIRVGNYEVTNNVDISYENTGIVTLDYHFIDTTNGESAEPYAFGGNMRGTRSDITITQNSSRKMAKIGMFSSLTGNNTFSNLTFAGTIENADGVGGIAYQTFGTGLTLEDITMQKTFTDNTGIIGGVLAVESGADEFTLNVNNIVLASEINAGPVLIYSGFVTQMDLVDISINNVVIGGSISDTVNAEKTVGAFLGQKWTLIGGKIVNVTVQPGTTLESGGSFAALIGELTTHYKDYERVTLDTVKLANLTVNVLHKQKHCGLLIQDADYAVVEVIDYDSTGCVVNNPYTYFDEVVGTTKSSRTDPWTKNTGIVSLHSRGKRFPEYHYENKVESLKNKINKYTMYYYDVFQILENEDGSVNDAAKIDYQGSSSVRVFYVDTPEKFLLWNLATNTSSNVTNTFQKYFVEKKFPSRDEQRFVFSGKIDLSNICFYPITRVYDGTYSGTDNATFIFGATEEMANWELSNVKEGSQHYAMQSGLFANILDPASHTINMSISNITLAGQVANLGTNSGALMASEKGFNGGATLTNITLDNLRIAGYNGEAGAALLISSIPDNGVTFENIRMINYPAGTKAASALIGSAGYDTAANLTLRFSKMKIADDVTGGNRHNGDALQHASFLYSYDYTDDAEINTGSGIYLFSEADARTDNMVTYGSELTGDTEFSDTSNGVLSTMRISPSHYIPYVYTTEKKIEVNPKTGDVLKGCGTYEDPYIIEDAKQFLTLYRYMNEKGTEGDYQYESFYSSGNGWKIIKPGTDAADDFCSSKHVVTWNSNTASFEGNAEHIADVVTFGNAEFPTPEELSRAYYQLGADIDLSAVGGDTYKTIADEFVGFGTETRPFVGVWYGAGRTITLPDRTDKTYSNYGFIQYAQGAVVKDVTINAASAELANAPTITGAAGSVIATVLGGDNIIDNVTIRMALNVNDANVPAGGYVGVVKKGGVILRNVSTSDVQQMRFNVSYNALGALGAIVGKVEDGFVLYEGGGSQSYAWTGITAVNGYSAVPNYTILNADALENRNLSVSAPSLNNKGYYRITVTIPNAAGLQIMSMALNSDSLNVRPSDYAKYTVCGYTEKSRSRKAQYNGIGTSNSYNADYLATARYDNVNGYSADADKAFAYPYLYDLMGITGSGYLNYLTEASGKQYSVLNPSEAFGDSEPYHVTWSLGTEQTYDMTQFGSGFRGIGAIYQVAANYGGTFHFDFHGNNSRVHLNMTRNMLSTETANETIGRVGLFNGIYGATDDWFEITDLQISGSLAGSSNSRVCAGGLAGYIQGGHYYIANVRVEAGNPLVITSYIGDAGGLVGEMNQDADHKTYVTMSECYMKGTNGSYNKLEVRNDAGGLIGRAIINLLELLYSDVSYLQISKCQNGSIGGMVGYLGYIEEGTVEIKGTREDPSVVSDCTIGGVNAAGFVGRNDASWLGMDYVECRDTVIGVDNTESAGGIIAMNNKSAVISVANCSGLTLRSYANAGGVIGKSTNKAITTSIYDTTISNIETEEQNGYNGAVEGLGGVAGKNEQILRIENTRVEGTQTGETYSCQIKGTAQARNAVQGVGGLIGCHLNGSNTATLVNCAVDTVEISTDMNNTGTQPIAAGGLIGYVSSPVEIEAGNSCECSNLNISAPLAEDVATGNIMAAGGGFGYVTYQDSSRYGKINCGALNVTETIINGKYAGGLIGYSEQAAFNLKGIGVTNNNITSDTFAGGFVGYLMPHYASKPASLGAAAGKEGYTHAENLTLQNNSITAKTAGGLIGGYEAATTLPASIYDASLANNVIAAEISANVVTENPAVGGLMGRTISNSSKGSAPLHCDCISIANTNQIGIRQTGSDAVQLVRTNGDSYRLSNIAMPARSGEIANDYNAIDALEQEYGCFVGAFVGVWEASNVQMYITDSGEANGKFVFPVLASNPPVVDVGRTPEQSADAYRSYCHVIYGARNSIAASESQHLGDVKTQIDNVKTEYTGGESYIELLTGLRATMETMDLFELSYQDSYQFPGTDLKIAFPLLVYRVQNGTLQDVLESVTDVMTNVAGNSASDMEILSIECVPKLFDGNTFTTGNKASISASVTNGTATYTMAGYDGVTDNKLSYTELVYTYNNNGRTKTFVVPVFVEEPILYSVHSKIMEGKVSDVSTVRQNGTSEENNNIIMANDSNYTLLLEYTYGEAREQMVDGVAVNKMFYLEQNNESKAWPMGTQLLLIDVTGGNKPYYYTVTEANVFEIKVTDFRDSSGQNAYKNPSINSMPDETDEGQEYYTDLGEHQLTNTAVERYLLTVLSNDNDIESKLYSFHAGLSISDKSLEDRFQLEEEHKEESVWNITAIPGLMVSLVGKGSETDITGSISKTDGVTIKATFELMAQDIYWVERGKAGSAVIDSSNSSKYLEIAFYLRDNNGNRVELPTGTNFSYKLGDGSYSGNSIIADSTIVYYYKDIRTQFSVEDSEYYISNIDRNMTVPIEYVLDFSGADLSTVLDDSYVGWIELLRTGNRDYPMGNGNGVDSYSEAVDANAMQELGFVLRADDTERLAINTYPQPAEQNIIPGHVMFDFSENLELAGDGVGKDLVLEKWASLDYEVTYQLYKKTAAGYVPYTGTELPVQISAPDQTGLEKSSKTGSLTVTYNFTEDQIKNGNNDTTVEGVLSLPCKIIQNTADLIHPPGAEKEDTDALTNYRLEATLKIKEQGVTEEVSEKTTDFFVYTVTKLKFDL